MIAANTNIIEEWYAKKTCIHTNKMERCYLAWCCATGPLSIDQYIYEHTLMAIQAGVGQEDIPVTGQRIPCRYKKEVGVSLVAFIGRVILLASNMSLYILNQYQFYYMRVDFVLTRMGVFFCHHPFIS
jgi:hypothetical protein